MDSSPLRPETTPDLRSPYIRWSRPFAIGSLIGAALACGVSRGGSGSPGAGHDAGTPVTVNAAPPLPADTSVGVTAGSDAAPPAMPAPIAVSAGREPSAMPIRPARRSVRHRRVLIEGKDCTTERVFSRQRALPPCPSTTSADGSTSAPDPRVTSHSRERASGAGVVQDTLFEDRH